MSRNLFVIAVAIAMLTVFFPATSATHFSAGYEGSVGHQNLESPDDPSVVGEERGAEDTPYGVGTKTTDCYEATDEVDPNQALEAATTDGFCGQLVYNQDTSYQATSPPDQQILREDLIGTFDVQRTWRTGSPVGYPNTCEPMCDDGDGIEAPVAGNIDTPVAPQNTTWDAVHTAGSAVGLTDDPETADEKEDSRSNAFVVFAQNGHPTGIAQRNADIWEMNGWTVPALAYGGGFVGFLYDEEGNTITGEELREMLAAEVESGALSPDTELGICGFTPDRNFQGNFDQGFCEANMFYVPAESGNGPTQGFRGYEDPCESPTYVCGAATGGYYESQATGLAGAYSGRYQGEHMRWHWIVGPNNPDCAAQEPGVDFGSDGADDPFLAHDLDVYTPPQRLSLSPDEPSVSTDNLYSADDGDDGYATNFVGDGRVSVPLVPQEDVKDEAEPVYREELLEPNHVGAESSAIDDDSRIALNEERTIGEDCGELTATESDATNDPWVSYIDNGVDADRSFSVRDGVVEDNAPQVAGGVQTGQIGLYGTDDTEHDPNNDPTTDAYSTSGTVGIFADKNDDGDYEVVLGPSNAASTFGQGVYDGQRIDNVGAYPMLWDMHVEVDDDTGEPTIDTDAGCTGPGGDPFGRVMADAGYGPNTGLVQAIYLSEPTVFTDGQVDDPEAVPYPGGNNIYLLMNDAARTLWDGDIDAKNGTALDAHVDALAEDLKSYVVDNHGADEGSLEVHAPGVDLGLDNDFLTQCGEDTGGYSTSVSFTHTCETGCAGDTIATKYVFEVEREDGTLGGKNSSLPAFQVDGVDHDFGSGINTWTDIDAFDGNADRSAQRMTPPPAE